MAERNDGIEEQAVREVSAGYWIEAGAASADDVPPGYKRTEVGVIPEDWRCASVSQLLCEISMGPFGSDIKVSNFVEHGVPVLDGHNVRQERVLDDFSKFVTIAKAKSLKKAVAYRGDLVVTHRGTIGQISYIPMDSAFDEYVISQSQFRARFNSSVLPQWVTAYFLSEKGAQKLLEGKGHTGVPAIAQPTTTFRKLWLPLPSISEQRAIATALSDADALIESLDRLIAKKRAIKQAAMQQLLTGQTRLPGFTGEWQTKRLGELLIVRYGHNQTKIEKQDGKYPILATGGEIGRTDTALYEHPSVLIGRKGTIDRPRYIDTPFWTVDTLFYTEIRPNAYAKFIFYLFERIPWRDYNEASGVPSLNGKTIEKIQVLVPNVEEQTAIATVLSDMDTEIETIKHRRDKARQIKQGMMQQLLTGRIRLVDCTVQECVND